MTEGEHLTILHSTHITDVTHVSCRFLLEDFCQTGSEHCPFHCLKTKTIFEKYVAAGEQGKKKVQELIKMIKKSMNVLSSEKRRDGNV